MDVSALLLQTYKLAEYLLNNSEVLDEQSKKECLNRIISILENNLICSSSNEEISMLRSFAKDINADISGAYILIVSALIKYCAEQSQRREQTLHDLSERFMHLLNIRTAYHKRYPGESIRFKGKGVIYSVITGNYDSINEPMSTDEYEYILITDHMPENYKGKWQVRIAENKMNLSPHRLARYIKMHPTEFLSEYDYSIYIDGALKVVGDFKSFIDIYKRNSGIICFPHHSNNSIIEEADTIKSNMKASEEELDRQIENYKSKGYIEKGYIIETGCLIREHRDEKLQRVMEDWWEELCSYSHNRDQMSFDYSFWKNNYDYDICDLPIYNNPWCVAVTTH